ncbi:hypothetical protein LPTSP3_g15130 [Leptospira kobayashii]|uniref:Uncharacterized protein n=1 Tax=Leptospira kobayashii TaxID=1917830 RepID=A0ABM7UIJ8_9LEPT|nr:hypothetical protein [Leptospira kobayashii]BDA78583.1 hypothetical protein LPTSP3_g15130 [Leptospira kobayashii]
MTKISFEVRLKKVKDYYHNYLIDKVLDVGNIDFYDFLTDFYMKSGFMYEEVVIFHNNMIATESGKFCSSNEYLKESIRYIRNHEIKRTQKPMLTFLNVPSLVTV